jgi:hypothetical protein
MGDSGLARTRTPNNSRALGATSLETLGTVRFRQTTNQKKAKRDPTGVVHPAIEHCSGPIELCSLVRKRREPMLRFGPKPDHCGK